MSTELSLAQASKLLNISERRLQQLAKTGHVVKTERGKYPLLPTVHSYIAFLKQRGGGGSALAGGSEADRNRLMKAKADIATFEARRLARELVAVVDVSQAWSDMVARFRARAIGIPSKAAPLLAAEDIVEACHEILETFINEALAELAETSVEGGPSADPADASRPGDGGPAAKADDLDLG